MNEIAFLTQIISEEYAVGGNPFIMYEPNDDLHNAQQVEIVDKFNKLQELHLYRFADDDSTHSYFQPFFNHSCTVGKHAPKDLNKFCDYILLLSHDNKPYVFLLELKRGTTDDAPKQLDAAKMFMQYVINNAERVKSINNNDDFSERNINFRELIIKETFSNKQITKPKDVNFKTLNTCQPCYCNKTFSPIMYCVKAI